MGGGEFCFFFLNMPVLVKPLHSSTDDLVKRIDLLLALMFWMSVLREIKFFVSF